MCCWYAAPCIPPSLLPRIHLLTLNTWGLSIPNMCNYTNIHRIESVLNLKHAPTPPSPGTSALVITYAVFYADKRHCVTPETTRHLSSKDIIFNELPFFTPIIINYKPSIPRAHNI